MTTLYRASNLTIDNGSKNPNRYYLDDFFISKPIEKANSAGAGISSFVTSKVYYQDIDIITVLYVNLVGCKSYGNNKVLGEVGSSDEAHITQITTAKNGYIYSVNMTCIETPLTGDPDINLEINTSTTPNVQDANGGTNIINSGDMSIGKSYVENNNEGSAPFDDGFANGYLFLENGSNDVGNYAAGKIIITLRGTNSSSSIVPLASNTCFELIGTNAINISHSSTQPGIELTTAGADNDEAIICPTVNNTSSAWTSTLWGTEDNLELESCIITDSSISNMAFWSGLKLTSTGVYATDANQAYFLYSTNADLGSLTTNANLHFVYSIGGTDYVTDLGLALATSTKYIFKIHIDSDRKIRIYVNETLYGLATTSVAGGTTQSITTEKSNALTNNIDLIPYTGIQSLSAAANTITLCYVKINKVI